MPNGGGGVDKNVALELSALSQLVALVDAQRVKVQVQALQVILQDQEHRSDQIRSHGLREEGSRYGAGAGADQIIYHYYIRSERFR